MKEEYTRETYPSFGKKYNGEKAIISLTFWRARINTVSKTLFSLLKQCPGFHIVLVLSEEEFPKMMDELPENLKVFAENELIEVLWVYKNYKSLKKILFTMDKYKTIPVISADDDCIYICNYAEELYQLWLTDKLKICTINAQQPKHTNGTSTLYYPYCFGNNFIKELQENKHLDIYKIGDDAYYEVLRFKNNNKIAYLKNKTIWKSHDEYMPLHNIYNKNGYIDWMRNTIQKEDAGDDLNL